MPVFNAVRSAVPEVQAFIEAFKRNPKDTAYYTQIAMGVISRIATKDDGVEASSSINAQLAWKISCSASQGVLFPLGIATMTAPPGTNEISKAIFDKCGSDTKWLKRTNFEELLNAFSASREQWEKQFIAERRRAEKPPKRTKVGSKQVIHEIPKNLDALTAALSDSAGLMVAVAVLFFNNPRDILKLFTGEP